MLSVHLCHPITDIIHVIEAVLGLQIEIRLKEELAEQPDTLVFKGPFPHDGGNIERVTGPSLYPLPEICPELKPSPDAEGILCVRDDATLFGE